MQALLSSMRNSNEAHLHLLTATGCSKLLYSAEREQLAMQIKGFRSDIGLLQIPTTDEMLGNDTAPYPLRKSFTELENVTSFVIHSSGTTGTANHHITCE